MTRGARRGGHLGPLLLAVALLGPALGGCLAGTTGPPERLSLPEALLLEAPYPDLIVDVDHVDGRTPTPEALQALERELANVTGKHAVTVGPSTVIPIEDDRRDRVWSMKELDALHRRTIDAPSPECCQGWNGTAYLHALFVNGELPQDHGRTAVGLQGGTGLYIAKDVIDQLAGSRHPAPSNPRTIALERTVLVHEAGHALGLVDDGVPMQTPRLARDDACRCHSRYEDSVMYPSVEVLPDLADLIGDGTWTPYRFDPYDRADLEAFRKAHAHRYQTDEGHRR